MIIASISDKSNNVNYYVNLNEKKMSISCVTDNKIFYLSKEEAMILYNNIFISEMNFYEEKDEYKIYLDNANNKRYFKDGKEDLIMFYNNNGYPATMYSIKDMLKNFSIECKAFFMKNKHDYNVTCIDILTLILIASTLNFSINILDSLDVKYEEILGVENQTPVTYQEIENYIMTTEDKEMTNEKKQLLCNEYFIKDALSYIPLNKSYILRKRMNNLGLEYLSEEKKNMGVGGYVNPLSDPNTIHIMDGKTETFKSVAPHEFIHLFQDDNQYAYIKEACADIMADEYFSACYYGYNDAVKRVRSLMEIIGPRPVMECNFKGTSSFEQAIKKNLNEEDSKELLRLFAQSPFYDKKSEETDKRVDELLAKMYKNKFGKDIKDNIMINYIYNSDSKMLEKRIYFNKKSPFYDKDFLIQGEDNNEIAKEELDYDYVVKNGLVERYEYIFSKRITKEEYYNADNKDDFSLSYSIKEGYHEEKDEIQSDNDSKSYTEEEAMKKGIITDVIINKKQVYEYNTLQECFENHGKNEKYVVDYRDGSSGYFENNKFIKYIHYSYKVPPITEKVTDNKNDLLGVYEQILNFDNNENELNEITENRNKKTR